MTYYKIPEIIRFDKLSEEEQLIFQYCYAYITMDLAYKNKKNVVFYNGEIPEIFNFLDIKHYQSINKKLKELGHIKFE